MTTLKQIPTSEAMLKSFKNHEARVEYVLEKYPQTRGSDTLLWWRYCKEFYPQIKIKFNIFKELLQMPSYETCRRWRQRLTQKPNPAKRIPAGRRLDLRPLNRTQIKRQRRENILRPFLSSNKEAELSEFGKW